MQPRREPVGGHRRIKPVPYRVGELLPPRGVQGSPATDGRVDSPQAHICNRVCLEDSCGLVESVRGERSPSHLALLRKPIVDWKIRWRNFASCAVTPWTSERLARQ